MQVRRHTSLTHEGRMVSDQPYQRIMGTVEGALPPHVLESEAESPLQRSASVGGARPPDSASYIGDER